MTGVTGAPDPWPEAPPRGALLPLGSIRSVVRALLMHDPDGGPVGLVLAALTGLVFAVVILTAGALIRDAASQPVDLARLIGFLALVAGAAVVHGMALARGMRSSERCRRALLDGLVGRLRETSLEAVEITGADSLSEAVARALSTVASGVLLVFQIVQHGLTLIVCALVILVTTPTVFLCLGAAAVVWGVLVRRRRIVERRASARAAEAEARFNRHLGEMIAGSRDLHLDPAKRRDLVITALAPAARAARDGAVAAAGARSRIMDMHALSWLLAMALLVFVLPRFGLSAQVTVAFLMLAVLWQWISGLLLVMPTLERAGQALDRLDGLDRALAPETTGPQAAPAAADAPAFERLVLSGLTYRYPDAGGVPGFGMGPIDLTLRRGEILFLVGGNGSGKSTLIKVLTGLYAPSDGDMTVDGHPVTLAAWRSLFAYVPTDLHLFRRLYGIAPEAVADGRWVLDRLGVARVVGIHDGAFTTRALSAGQRKRLGLAVAIMERRPVLVLDEWAADQDPESRRLFYTEVLPDLRARGLTAVVVSHDDRYFTAADRVVKMRDGRVVAEDDDDG
ncbi:ATP-binding cassette domain-containing protein [Roseospira visakhapatnamensis]|uniref:Putative ATP-binding cassette transporter n=1 Tax=Roseospira visakhapatnamensis TaxID=390880 RepID=A0A7W6R9X7_9PROT|nr:ATP-binding cassette domain-containing protein [Roseospira visakhapatnamensis]MBB4264592.1 putative ATP-binding cassette transporter [Roseospira visakhapatnamensis]